MIARAFEPGLTISPCPGKVSIQGVIISITLHSKGRGSGFSHSSFTLLFRFKVEEAGFEVREYRETISLEIYTVAKSP